MLAFPSSWRVYLAVEPVDMRKHFDGLWAEVDQRLGEDPRQGALFVFSNKVRNRLKLLYWDGTGGGCWRSGWRRGGSPGRWAATAGSSR